MSAVLTGPSIPSQFAELFQNKAFTDALIDFILNNPEARERIEGLVDIRIIEEHQLLQRLREVENTLGVGDWSILGEDVITLEDRVLRLEGLAVEPIKAVEPRTTLEHKATELVDHLKTVEPRNKEGIFMISREITDFLKYDISEPCRMKCIQNPRQAKRDVILKASKMFPNIIVLDKKKQGRKDVRIVYKPENDTMQRKRMDTYIRPKPII